MSMMIQMRFALESKTILTVTVCLEIRIILIPIDARRVLALEELFPWCIVIGNYRVILGLGYHDNKF